MDMNMNNMNMNTSTRHGANNSNNSNNPADEHDRYDYYYPREELEYLSTEAFNHAVDLYHLSLQSRSEENADTARRWARKAIELAELIRGEDDDKDKGKLVDELRGRFDELLQQQT